MSSKQQAMSPVTYDVLFFGSIAVSTIGHEVHDETLAVQLKQKNLFTSLCITASAPYVKTEEAFGLASTSPLYEVHSAGCKGISDTSHPKHHRQQAAFLPVMLRLAQGAAVEEVPSVEDQDSALPELDASSNDVDPAPSYTSASVRIEVGMSCSGSAAVPVGVKKVFLPSLNYLASRDMCVVVRIPLWSDAIEGSGVSVVELERRSSEHPTVSGNGGGSSTEEGVALSVYAMLRVTNLSGKVRLALEADDAVRHLLDLPDTMPKMRLGLTQKGEAPYGVMPLTELYHHYRQFFSCYSNTVIKRSDAVMEKVFSAPRQREADASFPHRWNALAVADLRPVLMGEVGFAPLLLTLAHCTNLRALYADGNRLGDLTCARLSALFRRHRYLSCVSLSKNTIHEAGGEQLLRLVRHNLRITSMSCHGNYFSDSLRNRIEEVAASNASVIDQDPLNIFSSSYNYLHDLSSLPESLQQKGLQTWAMLSSAPVGDVDVMVRNFTTSTERTLGDSPATAIERAKAALRARDSFSVIPPAALAPLLNEIMRTVSVGVSRVVPDPLVRSLFSDLEALAVQEQKQIETKRHGGLASGGIVLDYDKTSPLPLDVCDALGGVYTPPIDSEMVYGRSFMRIVVTALRGIALGTPWAKIAQVLEGIGRIHRDLGVMPEDYWLAVHIFMISVRTSCGAECYGADYASSFLSLLALAVRTAASPEVEMK